MSLNLQRFNSQAGTVAGVKQLFLAAAEGCGTDLEYVPRFYCEAKIDFADVRSGLRQTCSVSRALEIYPVDDDTLWTEDMVWTVDPSRVQSEPSVPARMRSLPAFVKGSVLPNIEACFLSYLLRNFEVRLFRSFALSIYSRFDESRDDFILQCMELLSEPFRSEMDGLRDVFNRRLEMLKEKYLGKLVWDEMDPQTNKSLYFSKLHDLSEWLADIFLRTEFSLDSVPREPSPPLIDHREFQEKLKSIESEAVQSIARILHQYREKACNIDEYIIRPNLKDVRLVRTCVLWMPVKDQ
jgi:hypothetical protein